MNNLPENERALEKIFPTGHPAFFEGRGARAAGQTLEDNPYTKVEYIEHPNAPYFIWRAGFIMQESRNDGHDSQAVTLDEIQP